MKNKPRLAPLAALALLATALLATTLVATPTPTSADVNPSGPVTAAVTGSTAPPTGTEPATVTNGGFTITGTTPGSAVGDGIDETTDWTFDLAADADYATLPTRGSLERATLTLTLTPGDVGVADDQLSIGGLPAVDPTDQLSGLVVGQTETVAIDLLTLYAEWEILGEIAGAGGLLAASYGDDTVVSFAELDLLAVTEDQLLASDATAGDQMGNSVAVDGNTAVIGAPGGAGGSAPGKAYVFARTAAGWVEQAILQADLPVPGEAFGFDVAIDAGTIVVGTNDPNGRAYVFTGSGATWTQEALIGPVGGADQFGREVDVQGDRLAVGDRLVNQVHVFERTGTTWTLWRTLTSPATGGLFGDNIVLDGDRAIVGAPIETVSGVGFAGSVYVFDMPTNTLSQTIQAPEGPQAFRSFGNGLAYDDDGGGTLAIGAPGDAGPGLPDFECGTGANNCPGAVYIYSDTGSGFTQDTKFLADDLDLEGHVYPGAQFGLELDLDGDTLLVGSENADSAQVNAGKAYVYERLDGTWTPRTRLSLSDQRQGDLAGRAVAIAGPTADEFLIGVVNNDWAGGLGTANEGALYVFNTTVTAPNIEVAPGSVEFGQVEIGQSATAIITITNTGNRDLELNSLPLTGDASLSITAQPGLPAVLTPMSVAPTTASVDVEITFTPTVAGAVSGTLTVGSDDPDQPSVAVALTGEGVADDPDPSALMADLLAFYDQSLADGTLIPQGPGNSAANRAQALRNMLEAASDAIDQGSPQSTMAACGQLQAALAKTDGDPTPPDFVAGANAPELAQRIQDILATLGC